jgi:hypothetical protein
VGVFFERPPATQEPHWPFAWGQAKHDWILRFDTDEFPGEEMKVWLKEFRGASEPPEEISGYTCIWPLWNGQRAVPKKWPAGRNSLFLKQRVRFFGMNEQTPIPDGRYEPLDFVLHHQPKRKSYGMRNILFREQAKRGMKFIAHCPLGKPTDLNCWRRDSETWPEHWEQIRQRPLYTGCKRLLIGTLRGLHAQWRAEQKFFPIAAISGPLHDCLVLPRIATATPFTFL